jgi:hypothetical protein
MQLKKIHFIESRTSDLSAYSIVPLLIKTKKGTHVGNKGISPGIVNLGTKR